MNDVFFYRIIRCIPNFLWVLKLYLIRSRFSLKGKNVRIPPDCFITSLAKFEVGSDVFINKNFFCSANEGVLIGDRVMFGANCSIVGGDHKFDRVNETLRFPISLGNNNKIIIESDVWIGHGTIILKNGFIGEGTVIGAGSLVNKILLPYSVYAGNPIRFIKPRFNTEEELLSHLTFLHKKYSFTTKYNRKDLSKIYENK